MAGALERRHPLVEVGLPLAQAVADEMLPGPRVTDCVRLEGGYCNSSYRLALDRPPHDVVLRVITHDAAHWKRQVGVMMAARAHVPVPEVLDARESEVLRHPCAMLEFVHGVPAPKKTSGSGRAIGEALGRIAGVRFGGPGLLGNDLRLEAPFSSMADAARTYFRQTVVEGRAGARLGERLADRLQAHLESNIGYLESLPDTEALVHADYNAKNLLMQRDREQVAAILDWDFSFSGSPLADLGNLLRYPESPDYERGVLEGFVAAGGLLPTWWRRASRLLDLFSQLEFLDARDEHPQRFADALGLVRRMLDEWKTYPA